MRRNVYGSRLPKVLTLSGKLSFCRLPYLNWLLLNSVSGGLLRIPCCNLRSSSQRRIVCETDKGGGKVVALCDKELLAARIIY